MKKLCLTISLFATITGAYCQSEKVNISTVPITLFENPDSGIRDIAQDQFGNIWMQHDRDGIVRYDGVNTEWFAPNSENPDAIVGGRLEEIFVDKEGVIWISTYDQGLERFDPEKEIFTHFKHDPDNPNSIRSNVVRSMMQDEDGILWIGTNIGLDMYNPDSGEISHVFSEDPDAKTIDKEYINHLYQDKSGTIWIGCGTGFNDKQATGGLYKYDKKTDEISPYLHTAEINSLIDNRITALYEDSRGTFWVGTAGDGLHTMDRKNGTFERHEYDPLSPRKLSRPPLGDLYPFSDDFISFFEEDEFGNIWIGTFEGGVNRYDPSSHTTTYFGMDELGTESFLHSLKTKDNLIWLMAWAGNKLGESLFKINSLLQGLEYKSMEPYIRVRSMVETADKNILLGTNQGLRLLDTNGNIQNISLNNDFLLSDPRINYLEKNESGNIWISTEQGLYEYNSQTKYVTEYRHNPNDTNSISHDEIITTLQIDDKLFIGTEHGLNVLNLKNGFLKSYFHDVNDINTLLNDRIFSLEQDHKGNIWIGTPTGINKFDVGTGHFKRYDGSPYINSIFEDSKHNLWASSGPIGLLRYDEGSDDFSPYYDKAGILSSAIGITDLTEDRSNNLWMKTMHGIIRLNLSNESANIFGKSWGIVTVTGGGRSRGSITTSEGDILIGNRSGVLRIKPKYFQKEVQTFDPYFSKFYVDNLLVRAGSQEFLPKPLSQTDEITLKSFQNDFALEYGHADYRTTPSEHKIQFRLKNYNDDWRNSTGENKASYYDVPHGKYVFEVRASNINGVRTEKSLAITILPPWYKTYWAYAIYVLMLLGFIYAVHRFQKERIIKAEREKSRIKELEQSREIEKAYNDLAIAHENLKSTQSQLIQSEKMASLGELTAGIAHEIQNPLNFVNNFSEVSNELLDEVKEEITSTPLSEQNVADAIEIIGDLKGNLEKIAHHGGRASSIVKGMLDHSRADTGEKISTDINALCDEYIRLSYHGLRAKDKSFNSGYETHFDDQIPLISVVPQDIGRVLLNIINNAFYACTERSTLCGGQGSAVTPTPPSHQDNYQPMVSISTQRLDNSTTITIKDNGTGMTQETIDKVFQPFFTTKPAGQGTGLGMSISYDIITKVHGGELSVTSEPGKGSIFQINIPNHE